MKDLCCFAVEVANGLGATYADARIVQFRNQSVAAEDKRVSGIHDSESIGIGVRVIAEGAWGFAATERLEKSAVEEVAGQSVAIARAGALGGVVIVTDGVIWDGGVSLDDVMGGFDDDIAAGAGALAKGERG